MPYKDKEKVRQYQREWVRQKRVEGSTQQPVQSIRPDVKPELYDPTKHYPTGAKVMVYQGKWLVETVIPELDGAGQPVPLYD